MPRWTLARKASTLGSSQYPAAVSARISNGHDPAGMTLGRLIASYPRCSALGRSRPCSPGASARSSRLCRPPEEGVQAFLAADNARKRLQAPFETSQRHKARGYWVVTLLQTSQAFPV